MANERHERVLRQFFVEEAAGAAPADLLARSLERTGTARRRPRWYARIREVGMAPSVAVGLPTARIAYVLVILGLVLAALFAAFVAGAFRRNQVMPLGRNGPIAYNWQGNDHSEAGGTFLMNANGTGEHQRLLGAGCPAFSADGTVAENVHSPAVALNRSRYGQAPPLDADPKAAPEWLKIGSGGEHAWHDHRIHWMSPTPPEQLGSEGTGPIDTWTVPLWVDGE
jgi:hypothetical protein